MTLQILYRNRGKKGSAMIYQPNKESYMTIRAGNVFETKFCELTTCLLESVSPTFRKIIPMRVDRKMVRPKRAPKAALSRIIFLISRLNSMATSVLIPTGRGSKSS
eukprot:scaffold37735_cov37-Attheya_sp.AAC.1